MRLHLLSFALGALLVAPGSLNAQPAVQADSATMPGAYRAVDPAAPEVQQARDAIQAQLAAQRIETVHAAYIQVVAGVNFKLVCQVEGGSEEATWVFVIWHQLDGRWQLTSARRL